MGQSHLPMSLQQKSDLLNQEEKKLLSVKYQMQRIESIHPDDLLKHTKGLLFKIHVITGWIIPNEELYKNVLIDQLYKKLIEDYQDCSIAEIEYAFRSYGTTVKDWGKNMNLQQFDEVMIKYKNARYCLSELEEKLKIDTEVKNKIPTEDEVLMMRRELIEDKYQSFLAGKTSFALFPEDGIDTLIKDGFCSDDLYKDFIIKARENLSKSYSSKIEDAKLQRKDSLVNDLIDKRMNLLDEENIEVKILSKKMALMFCLYKFKEAGYKNIYIKEK